MRWMLVAVGVFLQTSEYPPAEPSGQHDTATTTPAFPAGHGVTRNMPTSSR